MKWEINMPSMKAAIPLLLSSFLHSVSAASPLPAVYTFDYDHDTSSQSPPNLRYETAGVVLSRRLGISENYRIHNGVPDLSIAELNALSGSQPNIVGDSQKSIPKLLIVIDGVKKPQDISLGREPTFFYERPSDEYGSRTHDPLLDRLMDQITLSRHPVEPGSWRDLVPAYNEAGDTCLYVSRDLFKLRHLLRGATGSGMEYLFPNYEHDENEDSCTGQKVILFFGSLSHNRVTGELSTFDKTYKEITKSYTKALSSLAELAKSCELETTVIILPPAEKGGFLSSLFGKRSADRSPESILEAIHKIVPSSAEPDAQASKPLKSKPRTAQHFVPVCHTGFDGCMSATSNCTGRGKCFKKFGKWEGLGSDCWACKCENTVVHNKDGTFKTTYWGGSSCQKKDISMPFLLLAGMTILLVGAVTYGIGLLYTVGSEELPSVIGAGVAGPKAAR